MPMSRKPAIDRFLAKIRYEDDHWVWTDHLNRTGYGQFFVAPEAGTQWVRWLAHRWSYSHFVGPIPDGLVIDHLCRLRSCVNPEHLEPVTSRENVLRSPLVMKTECKHGHPFIEGSYYIYRGTRVCKQCAYRKAAAGAARRRQRNSEPWKCPDCGQELSFGARRHHILKNHPDNWKFRSQKLSDEERAQARADRQRVRRREQAAEKGHW